MSRMNSRTRKKLYIFLVNQDGECCKNCGRIPPEVDLVVDHKDNNNDNNHPDNIQLLCRRCNYLKNPRRPLDLSEREEDEETELQKSRRLRPLVRRFILHEINERVVVSEKELLDGGAEVHASSQQTIKRILDSMCSLYGILERVRQGGTNIIRYKDSFYER